MKFKSITFSSSNSSLYGFTGTIYEKSKISIIEAKKEELKKENKRKNTI